ncbi:hypothetical protein TorRG33x02_059050 [Trema orientale]|uniref:Uncharacterized protein n=1 Tax=Trema orientale TaxID=63057 RepID=A0A2P5FKK9_TREOI|nr:hypothetical protein TorRG33x02_059050 [Trema orientale]
MATGSDWSCSIVDEHGMKAFLYCDRDLPCDWLDRVRDHYRVGIARFSELDRMTTKHVSGKGRPKPQQQLIAGAFSPAPLFSNPRRGDDVVTSNLRKIKRWNEMKIRLEEEFMPLISKYIEDHQGNHSYSFTNDYKSTFVQVQAHDIRTIVEQLTRKSIGRKSNDSLLDNISMTLLYEERVPFTTTQNAEPGVVHYDVDSIHNNLKKKRCEQCGRKYNKVQIVKAPPVTLDNLIVNDEFCFGKPEADIEDEDSTSKDTNGATRK